MALEGERLAPNKGQENTVFISYARENYDAARRFYNELRSWFKLMAR